MTNSVDSEEMLVSLDYHFNERQIKSLALLFRKCQDRIPDELIDFSLKIERAVYNSMSIGEAEAFFS